MTSRPYRQWLRTGVRLFDEKESMVTRTALTPKETYINNLTMDHLESLADLLHLDWRRVAPAYRR